MNVTDLILSDAFYRKSRILIINYHSAIASAVCEYF